MNLVEFFASAWGFGSTAILCATLVTLAFLGYKVKASADGIQATRDQHPMPEPIMPVKYARLMIGFMSKAIDHNNRVRDIWPNCLERQMRVYEEREVTVLGRLTEDFTKLDAVQNLDDDDIEDEIARFRAHICNALVSVKEHVRRAFRNNHFHEMTEAEWDVYVRDKSTAITDVISGELDKFWRSRRVPRNALRDIGSENSDDYHRIAAEVFKKARQLSIAAYQEEQEEKAKYASEIAMATGLDVSTGNCL